MTARRLREWPRAVAAASALAIVLVLIGVLLASAGSGGSTGSAKAAPVRSAPVASAQLRARIADLQRTVSSQSAQLATAKGELAASRAAIRCWKTKAGHPRRERKLQCPAG